MKEYIVDRFEGLYAICENEHLETINILTELLPPDTKEGDFLYINDEGVYCIDYEATEKSKIRISSKLNKLFD